MNPTSNVLRVEMGRVLALVDDGVADGGRAQHVRRGGAARAPVRGGRPRRRRLSALRRVLRPQHQPLDQLRAHDAPPRGRQREYTTLYTRLTTTHMFSGLYEE